MAKENNDDRLRRMKDLGKLLEDEELRWLAVKKLKSLLNCQKTIAIGGGETVEVDDNMVQAKVCEIILGYTDGPPSKRLTIILDPQAVQSDEVEMFEAMAARLRLPHGAGAKILNKIKAKEEGDAGLNGDNGNGTH